MSSCLVYYATSEGQTAKVAEHLRDALAQRGVAVTLAEAPAPIDPADFDRVIVGGSVHMGRYPRALLDFIRQHRAALEGRPSAFVSVCLAAGSDTEEGQAESRGYVEKMVKQTGWQPEQVAAFAGALAYTQYGLITRFIMKRIAAHQGLQTDTSRDYEFTDWASVESFAETFIAA